MVDIRRKAYWNTDEEVFEYRVPDGTWLDAGGGGGGGGATLVQASFGWVPANYQGRYGSGNTYGYGDAVKANDSGTWKLYISLVADNIGNDPVVDDGSHWLNTVAGGLAVIVRGYDQPDTANALNLRETHYTQDGTSGTFALGDALGIPFDAVQADIKAALDAEYGPGNQDVYGDAADFLVDRYGETTGGSLDLDDAGLSGGGLTLQEDTFLPDVGGFAAPRGSLYLLADSANSAWLFNNTDTWASVPTLPNLDLLHILQGLSWARGDPIGLTDPTYNDLDLLNGGEQSDWKMDYQVNANSIPVEITGIIPPTEDAGNRVVVISNGGVQPLTLRNLDTRSADLHRFTLPGNQDISLSYYDSVILIYHDRWEVIAIAKGEYDEPEDFEPGKVGELWNDAGTAKFSAALTAALTGTLADDPAEATVVTGGTTILITLTHGHWVEAGDTFDSIRQAIIDGLVSAGAAVGGWNATVLPALAVTDVVRTSDVLVTIGPLPAVAGYAIDADETVTATLPKNATTADTVTVASPSITIVATP